MKCKKTVTEKKRKANGVNSKDSTGPQSERGKNTSRFNAVVFGLFAKNVVIPLCDGEGSQAEFDRLLNDLQEEVQPEGPLEAFWVMQIAESMWKLRRVNVAERSSIHETMDAGKPRTPDDTLIDFYREDGASLKKAQAEIKTKGTLSSETYAAVRPILEARHLDMAPDKIKASLEKCMMQRTEEFIRVRSRLQECMLEDFLAAKAILPEATMNSIQRADKTAKKKLDWALQRLFESQQRRLKARSQ